MIYIALEEAFSIPELTDRQPPPWPANRTCRGTISTNRASGQKEHQMSEAVTTEAERAATLAGLV
jgi:hypothetical protein